MKQTKDTNKGKTRKLLLNESLRNLGKVGDVVEVSAGYARNYLVPNHLAVEPTPSNLKRVEERRKEVERLEQEKRARQAALIGRLEGVEIALERRANEQGNLFGSVGANDILRALEAQGFSEIESEEIHLPGKLDRVDRYDVAVVFADDLRASFKVYVAPDPDSKAAMEAYAKDQRDADAANAAATE